MAGKRPSVFIGTSREGVALGRAIQVRLDESADVTMWDDDVFELTVPLIQSLLGRAGEFDFAIFVLTPDDVVLSRSQESPSPRDNVIFEIGMFMGLIGLERVFLVHQEGAPLKLPTDLLGVTTATYREHEPDRIQSVLGPACTRIEREIVKQGLRSTHRKLALPESVGVRRFYYGREDNSARNDAKQLALETAEGDAVLIAHSGNAFLATRGSLHPSVEKMLAGGKARFQVVLLNPYSVSAIEMYLNWLRSFEAQDSGASRKRVTQEFLPQQSKLLSSLDSYRGLRRRFEGRIEARLTSFDSGCTVLWTSGACFVEPYYRFDPYERARNGLNTYELELEPAGALSRSFGGDDGVTHIDFFRRYSMPFEKWEDSRESLFEAARTNLELMRKGGEVDRNEADCIAEFLSEFASR